MRKLALLFAVVLVVAACSDVDQAERDEAQAAAAVATTTAPVADHTDDADDGHDDDADDHDGEATVEADRIVEVVLAEFAFAPGTFEVAAGETVTFVVTNTGVVEHEMRLSNEARVDEHLEGGHADEDHDETVSDEAETDHDDDDGGGHEAEDVLLLLEPGETGELTFTAPDDESVYTQVVCLVPGHFEAGMKAPLTISR